MKKDSCGDCVQGIAHGQRDNCVVKVTVAAASQKMNTVGYIINIRMLEEKVLMWSF